ncbi:MAG: hypothetical protein HDR85_01460 [Bacteroides sp.]|nr:hypothetical protein [Bacteroides sp.]
MESAVKKAKEALKNADAILIGASNGLSISEGYNIFADDDSFNDIFGDLKRKYGLRSVLDGCFHHYPTETARRKFSDRLVKTWVEDYTPSQVMKDLRAIVGDKPYFILTTNADEHLEAAGFAPDKVWEIEGTFRQLSEGKKPENRQVELDGFLNKYGHRNLVILEIGIGSQNRIIKLPLMQLVLREPNATYITLNLPNEIYIPNEIAPKSIALPGDIADTLATLIKREN